MKKERYAFLGLVDLAWIGIILVCAYGLFKFGIGLLSGIGSGHSIPIPSSIVFMYMGMVVVALALYLTIDDSRMLLVFNPIKYLYTTDRPPSAGMKSVWIATVVLFPAAIGFFTFASMNVSSSPPGDTPGIHFDLPGNYKDLKNPLEWTKENVREGSIVYIRNCIPCHGAMTDGLGWQRGGMNPKPANFHEPGTIAQLSDNYLMWRIKEGSPALPSGTIGYRSTMPAWQDILTEDEIWKIITWEYMNSGKIPANYTEIPLTHEYQAKTGKEIYEQKCFFCHGSDGNGMGPSVEDNNMNPLPRDFTKAQFKIRTTPHGSLPTDDDLFNIISKGIPGTVMPALEGVLSVEDRRKLVEYVKSFSDRFKTEGAPTPISVGSGISVTPAAVEKGKEVFKKAKCFECHGQEGRAEGPITVTLKDEWGMDFLARDLTQGSMFRRGNSVRDIYITISTGFNGTPMGSYADILSDEERWNLAAYVASLSKKADVVDKVMLTPTLIDGEIPLDANDPAWQNSDAMEMELSGQMIAEPRKFTPSILFTTVKAIRNDDEIAFLVEWDDPTNSQDETYRDAVALQFPVTVQGSTTTLKPHLSMGDKNARVNIWSWKAYWEDEVNKDLLNTEEPYLQNTVVEMNAQGYKDISVQPAAQQNVVGTGRWSKGRWQVVMKRALSTGDSDDVQFGPGKITLLSSAVWDSSNKDIGAEKSISSWYFIGIEEATSVSLYIYTFVSVVMAVSVQFWLIGWLRRKPKA